MNIVTVIIRKKIELRGAEIEMPSYQPPGIVSKRDRERADRLDEYLQSHFQEDLQEVLDEQAKGKKRGDLHIWHSLGRRLRTLAALSDLVAATDVDNGLLWQAVWQYLPQSLKSEGQTDCDVETFAERQRRRKDHLTLCYEIAAFDWSDVAWIDRWQDWYEIASRPGLIRDARIVVALGQAVLQLAKYPTKDEFRGIAKKLAEAFPTKRYKDSSLLDNGTITAFVAEAVGTS